jgi:hypothetical protein
MPPQPPATYYVTKDAQDADVYHCLYCETQGLEHHASDPALFLMHMEQRHDGRMTEGAPEALAAIQADKAAADQSTTEEPSPTEEPVAVPDEDEPPPATGD